MKALLGLIIVSSPPALGLWIADAGLIPSIIYGILISIYAVLVGAFTAEARVKRHESELVHWD